jgi:hypothetical protein
VGSLNRWLEEPEREPRLLSVWPIARSPRWAERINKPLNAAELKVVRTSINRGSPFGDGNGVLAISRHLNLQSTFLPLVRLKKKSPDTISSPSSPAFILGVPTRPVARHSGSPACSPPHAWPPAPNHAPPPGSQASRSEAILHPAHRQRKCLNRPPSVSFRAHSWFLLRLSFPQQPCKETARQVRTVDAGCLHTVTSDPRGGERRR